MTLNPHPPPSKSFFEPLRPRGPAGPLDITVGGWNYRVEGLDPSLRRLLEDRYAAFRGAREGNDPFRFRVLDGGVDHFVPPDEGVRPPVHPLSLGWEGDILLILSYGFAGWASLSGSEGEVALARGGYEKAEWCVENYLRVCTAWKAILEGGVLLHGASLVRSDRAWIFVGASGSGKSTLAGISRQGRVISDDLTLVRRLPEGFRVAGCPFRGTFQGGGPVKGFFPIAGIYRIFKSMENRLEACPPEHTVANLLASSPFVVDQLAREPAILDNLKALAEAHPMAYLHFNRDGNFWEVLPEG